MNAEQIVRKTIEEHELIVPGDHLILGVSGGPDSLCLLNILAKLQEELSFTLYALHVNHKIRGEEADADMDYTVKCCKTLGIPLTVKISDIPDIAKRLNIGEEEAGRLVRQQALRKKAQKIKEENKGARVRIVLAHNKDDQAETVLMRILRGTGVHGLAAMDYERDDGLIRPLLDCPRNKVVDYCDENDLRPRTDSTNMSIEYTRNRIRIRLIPVLEREFNPNLKDSLVRLADSAREDDEFINTVAKKQLPRLVYKKGISPVDAWDSMPRKQLANMDPAVAKRVIRLMFSRAGLKQDIGAIHLKQLLAAIDKPESTITEFPKGYTAEVSGDRVYFKAPNKETKTEKPRFKIKECKVISITEAPPLRTLDKNTCVLDAEKLLDFDGDIVLRSRKPGDRIRPIGLGGSKKLQDYLTDAKIPKEERNKIACLACGHEVLWVQGRAVSELCKVDGQTEYMLITQILEDQ